MSLSNSQIITIDSTFLHKTAVKPALKLLFEEGFECAEDEIRKCLMKEDEKVIIKMQY